MGDIMKMLMIAVLLLVMIGCTTAPTQKILFDQETRTVVVTKETVKEFNVYIIGITESENVKIEGNEVIEF
jgi:hypothetical protein